MVALLFFVLVTTLQKKFFIIMANINSAGDIFDVVLLIGVTRYPCRNCCIIFSSLFTPPDFLELFLQVSTNLSAWSLLLG